MGIYKNNNGTLENLTGGWTKLWEGTANAPSVNIPLSSYTEIGIGLNVYTAPDFIDFKAIPLEVLYSSTSKGEAVFVNMAFEGNSATIYLDIYHGAIISIGVNDVPSDYTIHKAYIYAR